MKRLFIAAALAALLSGCAAARPDPSDADPLAAFADFTVADLEAARADALAHDDRIAAACYAALTDFVAGVKARPGGTVKGAFSAYQRARDLHRGVEAGLPDAVHAACAPLVVDAEKVVLRLGLIGAGRLGGL